MSHTTGIGHNRVSSRRTNFPFPDCAFHHFAAPCDSTVRIRSNQCSVCGAPFANRRHREQLASYFPSIGDHSADRKFRHDYLPQGESSMCD